MNLAWVVQGAVAVQLAVKRASAPFVVGILCTIGKRCLELFCGLCVGNKREWACVLMLDWIRLFVCLAVCLSTHLGRTGLDQSFCVFDSNCVLRF
jgi:hypothetical protein